MSPRPIYRWKSFWLGVFVACFLGWAWRDSYVYHTELRVLRIGWGMRVHRAFGMSYLGAYPATWKGEQIDVIREPLSIPGVYERVRFSPETPYESDTEIRWVVIPDWLAMLLYLGTWGGWLGWRARKVRVKMKLITESLP